MELDERDSFSIFFNAKIEVGTYLKLHLTAIKLDKLMHLSSP